MLEAVSATATASIAITCAAPATAQKGNQYEKNEDKCKAISTTTSHSWIHLFNLLFSRYTMQEDAKCQSFFTFSLERAQIPTLFLLQVKM